MRTNMAGRFKTRAEMSSQNPRPRQGAAGVAPPPAGSAAAGSATAGGAASGRTGNVPEPTPIQQIPPRPDAGLLSLATIAAHYRIAADPFQLAHDLRPS